MRPLLHAALALACLAAGLGLPSTAGAATPVKVAIVVGPVGSLTPTYLHLAEAAATAAERHGATVARAYSPNATATNVLAAVADANVVVYFGHGYGHPSPYGALDTRRQNGWGLQGPRARGTHDDGLNGYLEYYGEDWIVANARPAPGFVMIYSNTCYAPGASEGGFAPATATVAAERVGYYSRKVFRMGGSAYFATDFDRGAADLVDRILSNRRAAYGAIFAADHRFVPGALTTQPHLFSAGQQIWLHRTKYTDGPPNYWYAFAGDPNTTPMRAWDPTAPTVALERPVAGSGGVAPWSGAKLRFSEAVHGVDESTVRLLDAAGGVVPADVIHNPTTGAVRLEPAVDLALSTRYTIVVEAGITDAAGNSLAPVRWSFATRLDADPLTEALPIVLSPGAHRLIRLAADGSEADERNLDLEAERWFVARTRARLPDRPGSWFEIKDGDLAGWWIAESPRAHAAGQTEQVVLPRTTVRLEVAQPSGGARVDDADAPAAAEREVTVDRRAVIDGRTHLRVVGGLPGRSGEWIEVPAGLVPSDVVEDRVLERRPRPAVAELRLDRSEHLAVRFDALGRVIDRRLVTGTAAPLATEKTLLVGKQRFHVVSHGDLAGWAIVHGDGVTVVVQESRDPR